MADGSHRYSSHRHIANHQEKKVFKSVASIAPISESALANRISALLKAKAMVCPRGNGEGTMLSMAYIRIAVITAMTAGLVGFQSDAQVAQTKLVVREKPICNMPVEGILEGSLAYSQTGIHVAFVCRTDKKKVYVLRDSSKGKEYDFIWPNPPRFSPDGLHLAYVAGKLGEQRLVLDEKISPTQYTAINPRIVFSPDGKHVAYVALAGPQLFGASAGIFFVVDGEKVKHHSEVIEDSFAFSYDSSKHAYIAGADGYMSLVLNGKESKKYKNISTFYFSHDSKRFGYSASDGKEYFFVLDGQEDKRKFDSVSVHHHLFSPDSKRTMYIARRSKESFLVVDGVESKAYESLREPEWSPDGSRTVVIASSGKKEYVVDNGVEGPRFDEVVRDSVAFSPDGKRLAYAVHDGSSYYYVIDGTRASGDFDRIDENSGKFSPDGMHFAFLAEREGRKVVVRDGVEGKGYVTVPASSIKFTANSTNLMHTAKRGDSWFYVINGVEGPSYSVLVPGALDGPESSDRIGFLGLRNSDMVWLRVEMEIQSG